MLPSRLFRNTGIPPALRSLVTPHASLPSTVAVQLRFRLGVMPLSMSAASAQTQNTLVTPPPAAQEHSDASSSNAAAQSSNEPTTTSQPLPEKMVPTLQITFTCTVTGCGDRSTHQFSKQAYEQGIVLVQCPKCKNRHLIADHLGWFKEGTKDGKLPRIEDILREKGEMVRRGIVTQGGDISYTQ
ncbi:DNL zinc finger-domain-containing protein [Pholiota molesta]|nr:DNL zinc finger-domain-containing protein [Pholiota molesta]